MSGTEPEFVTIDQYHKYRVKQDDDLGREFGRLNTKIDEGLERLNTKIDELDTRLSTRIDELNTKIDEGLERLTDELGQVKARLDQIDGRLYNKKRFLPRHDIARIGVYRPTTGFKIPSYFPKTINEFWKLQLVENGLY